MPAALPAPVAFKSFGGRGLRLLVDDVVKLTINIRDDAPATLPPIMFARQPFRLVLPWRSQVRSFIRNGHHRLSVESPKGHLRRDHTKIESTVRYLGIEIDDALSIAEQVDL